MRALAIVLLLAATVELHAQAPRLWAGLEPGAFRVGYRRDIWYPAKNDGHPMTFRVYGTDASVGAFIDEPVYAQSDATVASGSFPLVLIAHGNGEDAADQAILSEFLASHGYVVASVPSPMLAHRMTSESQVGAFAEEQKNALDAARREVSKQFRIGRVAVVSHSFGARAALLLAMQERSIRAIVSLDGGIGTATGTESLRTAPSFNANAPLPPLLHIYELLDPFMRPDFRFLSTLPLRSLKLEQSSDMHHVHFTTYGFAATVIPAIANTTHAGPHIRENVEATARSVLAFLQHYASP
ncbi:MAG TPA: hypothetical protein VJ901_22005 [Thermoanaerobaculia bacterium]|nr:hypothetical protein [Thermoanaerobaculia bacterium]